MIHAYTPSMAYRPRYLIVCDGSSFHVTWQCHNKDWLLHDDWAKQIYYDLLLKYKDRYGVYFHSYQFMENHPHMTGTITSREAFSNFFRVVNNLLARKVNKRLKRRGQVVMDRFKSKRIQDDKHMLTAMTYGDLNGVRCGRDKKAEDARWSSYAYYAYGHDDPLITPAPSYLTLGETPKERQQAYRDMVGELTQQGKIDMSNTCFIGDPDWIKSQYEALCNEMKAFKVSRREEKQRLSASDPPE